MSEATQLQKFDASGEMGKGRVNGADTRESNEPENIECGERARSCVYQQDGAGDKYLHGLRVVHLQQSGRRVMSILW